MFEVWCLEFLNAHSPVRLATKIRKLFSLDVLASLWEHTSRATHRVDASRILATIDHNEVVRIAEAYPRRAGARRINAWDDVAYWININITRAQDLWLDRAPHLRILDLGCGAGYFLYVCQFFGHSGIGLDTGDDPFFGALINYFGLHRVITRIVPGIPLPDFAEQYDLVTAHRICFHRITRLPNGNWNEWTPANWRFFIADIRTRLLTPKGRLLLDFNPRPDGSSFFTTELRDLFVAEGARVFRSKALFARDPKEWPRFNFSRHAQRDLLDATGRNAARISNAANSASAV
jgi:SAM-dependent methyltransferase